MTCVNTQKLRDSGNWPLMHGSIWPVTTPPSPRTYLRGFAMCLFLGGLFPTPGQAERDNSPPLELLIELIYVCLGTSFWKQYPYDIKTSRFDNIYWGRDNTCHNVVKTWTINLKTKRKLWNTSLIEDCNKNTLEWISVYLYILKALYPFSYTVYLSCLLIKAIGWRNISFILLPKKKTFEYASNAHSFEILKHSLMTDKNVDRLFLFNHSPKNSCVFLWKHVVLRSAAIVQTVREIRRTSQNQRDVFYFSHDPPTPGTEPLQTIPHARARRAGLVPGNRSNWTMH